MRVLDMTRIDSMVMPNPNRDIVENRKKKESYGIKDIKTVLNRMKLIIYWYQYIKTIDKPIVYYDYPRYSIFWYIVSILLLILIVLDGFCLPVQSEVPLHLPCPCLFPSSV